MRRHITLSLVLLLSFSFISAAQAQTAKKLDLRSILQNLQKQQNLQPQHQAPYEASSVAGSAQLKAVEVDNTTVGTEYTIPQTDIMLDSSMVGEIAPDDSQVH